MMFLKSCVKRFVRFLKRIVELFKLFIELLRGELDMAVIYATLIIKGYKKFSDVPDALKEKVREILEQLEVPELINT